jgi:thiamine kinase-like enzyme
MHNVCFSLASQDWGLCGLGEPSPLSTNGTVRRYDGYWLKARFSREQCEREVAILKHLSSSTKIRVPRLKENSKGAFLGFYGGQYWYVEENINGTHPGLNSAGLYALVAKNTCILHDELLGLPPLYCGCSTISRLEENLQDAEIFIDNIEILKKTENYISCQLDVMRKWPQQYIHGDLSHPNIIIDDCGICGFIDFEFFALGPREFDFATILVTALARASLAKREEEWVLRNISSISNISEESLLLACLAHRWMAALSNLKHSHPSNAALQNQLRHIDIFYSMLSG